MGGPDRRRAGVFTLPEVSTFLAWPRGIARLGVLVCVAVSLGVGLVYFARAIDTLSGRATANAALHYDDREFAGGNALVESGALYEARALISEDEAYRYVVGSGLVGDDELRAREVGEFARSFLMPRRPSADADWILCYACGPAELDGVEIIYSNEDRLVLGRVTA